MGQVGTKNHEFIGANYAYGLGLPYKTCKLISSHVNAKRYLCYSDPGYYGFLSDASKETLVHQGGVMTGDEAA
jgi:predicted HD phosphohydrolase